MPGKDERVRSRMLIDCDEVVRRALKIKAAQTGVKMSELLEEILRANLASQIREAERYMRGAGDDPGR